MTGALFDFLGIFLFDKTHSIHIYLSLSSSVWYIHIDHFYLFVHISFFLFIPPKNVFVYCIILEYVCIVYICVLVYEEQSCYSFSLSLSIYRHYMFVSSYSLSYLFYIVKKKKDIKYTVHDIRSFNKI
jgi:hypothetical protein